MPRTPERSLTEAGGLLEMPPVGGAGGGKGGWEGTENSLIVILKRWPRFFLVCKRASSKGPGAWILPGLSGVPCATYGRYVHIARGKGTDLNPPL